MGVTKKLKREYLHEGTEVIMQRKSGCEEIFTIDKIYSAGSKFNRYIDYADCGGGVHVKVPLQDFMDDIAESETVEFVTTIIL